MGAENKPDASKKRKSRFLPQNKPVKKGLYPLRPGVQGFFITCDGGREHQASREAINVLDTFYEQLVNDDNSGSKHSVMPSKRMNKIIKFSDSDASSDDESDPPKEEDPNKKEVPNHENQTNESGDTAVKDEDPNKKEDPNHENQTNESGESATKKQRLETPETKPDSVVSHEPEKKSIDKLIEAELKELGDRSKRHFVSLDPGCNGLAFIQMLKRDGDRSPSEIVQHMMTSVASTRKHVSRSAGKTFDRWYHKTILEGSGRMLRFILRVLPVEVSCYASEEEISRAIKPLVAQYFPEESESPLKFAVLFEARANTGIDRMAIINCVAKAVSGPHKVDLSNPDKTIVVQIVKTVCLIGVVDKYKELSKYNLRQLTAPPS